jgi:uncharacterized protein (TIGR02270 family)
MARTTEPFWDLVEESCEEAAFLWKRWEADLASPVRGLEEVFSWTEDRLQGALDGVRVAGDGLVQMVRSLLEGDDPSHQTIAAHLLAAHSSPEARMQLAAAIREAKGARLWAMVRGIEAADLDSSFAPVAAVFSTASREHLAALCRLKAFRRSTPGREVAAAFESGEPLLQEQALRVLRHAKDDSAAKYIASSLKADNGAVRKAAMECGMYQRQAGAWEAVCRLVHERDPGSIPFLSLVAALGSPEEQQSVIEALHEPALQRAGLFALGYIGTPEAIDLCLQAMRKPELARSAGATYCAITGVDLQRDGLTAPEPQESESPPAFEAEQLDANLIPEAHELWPLPDEGRVRSHWLAAKSGYAAGVRHLYGRPVDLRVLVAAVERGPMLRRPDLIAELTIRSGGRYDVEPRAFAHVQRRMMVAGRSVVL